MQDFELDDDLNLNFTKNTVACDRIKIFNYLSIEVDMLYFDIDNGRPDLQACMRQFSNMQVNNPAGNAIYYFIASIQADLRAMVNSKITIDEEINKYIDKLIITISSNSGA